MAMNLRRNGIGAVLAGTPRDSVSSSTHLATTAIERTKNKPRNGCIGLL